jgi:Domain of unknown function (DUF4383)
MNIFRKLAWIYAGLFFVVVASNYVPFLKDEHGRLCGLFTIDPIDDALHAVSGIWAAIAAWRSTEASKLYFKAFGVIYFGDAIIGLLFGQGYLDGGIFRFGPTELDLLTRILSNLPHIVIGGGAVHIGYVLIRRLGTGQPNAKTA